MKKRVLISTIFVVLLIVLSGIYFNCTSTIGWKKVKISELGTFKIPKDWIVTLIDGEIIITDKQMKSGDYKILLITPPLAKEMVEGIDDDTFKNEVSINSEIFSNSSMYQYASHNINGKRINRYSIFMGNSENRIRLFVYDNSIDKKDIIKIAKSFKMN